MSNVFAMSSRRTIKAPANEYDKSTIISIFPKYIREVKATLDPAIFELQPGSVENPSLLVIGSSSWWKDTGEDGELLEIPNGSVLMADSIIKDYVTGLPSVNIGEAQPGLFFIPGVVTLADLKGKYNNRLQKAIEMQKRYYINMVKMADVLWARTNGNPNAVPEEARLAARELGLNDKAWLKDYQSVQLAPCKACGTMGNPAYPVCSNCKAINDPKAAEKLGIKFAS